jgi:kumamolisin
MPKVGSGARSASTRRRSPRSTRTASEKANNLVVLTLYLREPGASKRHPGSAAAIAALSRRTTRKALQKKWKRSLSPSIGKIRRWARQHRMKIFAVEPGRRRLRLRGTVALVEKAFMTRFLHSHQEGVDYHFLARRPSIPRALSGLTQAVLGFDNRPRVNMLREMAGPTGTTGFYPSAMADLYGIAATRQGAGQCVALVEPAGGYDPQDLSLACRAMGLSTPTVTDISVGGGQNSFGPNAEADREVSLDVQVLAGIAPKARLAVYFTDNSETGIVDGLAQAVHCTDCQPDVVVITWGEPEVRWPKSARSALDSILEDAVRLRVTVIAAAGDDLATDHLTDNRAHVDYPASSPYVLGCGGTQITLNATNAAIVDEVVWHDGLSGTGGGISDLFQVPAFQRAAQVPPSINDGRLGRGVPDVAAAASAINGYRIFLHGSEIVTGGTSAAAPLWAALIALLNAERGQPVGFINPVLYENPNWFRAVISGDNAAFGIGYQAGPGWNACTGLGVPKGYEILAALPADAVVSS